MSVLSPVRSSTSVRSAATHLRRSSWPLLLFIFTLLLTYSYEVFSFNLTIDEEVVGGLGTVQYATQWIAQGRWSMGILTLALPSPVVPAVSTGVGVALSGFAWWLLSRRYLGMTAPQSALAAALAGTIPVLAFIFSFSTIAFGVGVANLLLVPYLRGLHYRSWHARVLGLLAGATAIGIYDTFLAALAALSLSFIIRRPQVRSAAVSIAMPIVAFGLSRAMGELTSVVANAPQDAYLSRYVDVAGFLADPGVRSIIAYNNVMKTLALSTERFGLNSPWLAIALLLLAALAFAAVLVPKAPLGKKLIRLASLLLLVLIPFGSEAISSGAVPLRSMLYLPVITLVLASVAVRGLRLMKPLPRQTTRAIVAAVIVLGVLGNATISNRLFASAETSYALDQDLAFTIGQEKDKFLGGDNRKSLPIKISGGHSWPDSPMTPTRETLGASFFEWNGGAVQRVAAFLRMQGVKVHEATPQQAEEAWVSLDAMPVYPQPGWITVHNGVLLLKFGPRTPGYQ
jgi:hypothetical protein